MDVLIEETRTGRVLHVGLFYDTVEAVEEGHEGEKGGPVIGEHSHVNLSIDGIDVEMVDLVQEIQLGSFLRIVLRNADSNSEAEMGVGGIGELSRALFTVGL